MKQALDSLFQDPEVLKSLLAEQHQNLLDKDHTIGDLRSSVELLNQRIKLLEAQVRLLKHRQFGARSEKDLNAHQHTLFDEAELADAEPPEQEPTEAEAPAEPLTPRKRRGKRKPLPADLPRERIEYDISEAEKRCHCGTERKRIGEVTSEQLDIIPAQVRVLKHVRIKYACPCCEGEVVEAPLPPQPIPKSQASPQLLAHVTVAKYQDAIPLNRQEAILNRAGLDIARNTLARWMIRLAALTEPLLDRMERQLMAASYVHVDETPVQVLKEPKKEPQSQSTMWVRVSAPVAAAEYPPIRLFHYAPSRSGEVAKRLLGEFEGYLHSDDYAAYQALGQKEAITALGCWAHVRRKFVEAAKAVGDKSTAKSRAEVMVGLIARLYAVEKQYRDSTPDERHKAREEQSIPILGQIEDWLKKMEPKVLPKSPLGKAIAYALKNWPKLTVYTCNGWLNIDNNPAENAIRPFVVGRKNWLFADTPAGAEASAGLYSLIETAKANGLEPFSYLAEVFEKIPAAKTDKDIEALLPWNLKPPPLPEPTDSG